MDAIEHELQLFAGGRFDGFFRVGFAAELLYEPNACKISFIRLIAEMGIPVFAQNGKKARERLFRIALSLVLFCDPDAERRCVAPERVSFDAADKTIAVVCQKTNAGETDLFPLITAMEVICRIADMCEGVGKLIAGDLFGEGLLIRTQKTRLQREKLQAFTAKRCGLQALLRVQRSVTSSV